MGDDLRQTPPAPCKPLRPLLQACPHRDSAGTQGPSKPPHGQGALVLTGSLSKRDVPEMGPQEHQPGQQAFKVPSEESSLRLRAWPSLGGNKEEGFPEGQ